ncbi:MAG: SDR family oxidoreductase [Candidatus Latescibacteria bacterium]|jgi:NAD(P)-dependent dehydrogenase (short-subunit alcohol dehydrogenase family)|nr:SDR family oxidoreductase [Candidatus Latescibacterota bacterium]
MKLSDKTAIVTGAASGIGKATAKQMVSAGARVVAADINAPLLASVVSEMSASGGQVTACVTDVGDSEQIANMVQCATESYGDLHILHNNAFSNVIGSATELAEDDWDRTLDVCLKSLFLGLKHAIPVIERSGGGSVVNTASVHSHVAFRNHAAYDAAKGGVVGLTRSAAVDFAPKVRVNAVLPGAILTGAWKGATEIDKKPFIDRCPMKRLGVPDDIASAVVFLASDAASFITGTTLVVDGGLTIVGDP